MNIKIVLASLVLVVLLTVVGAGGFYLGSKYRLVQITQTPASTPISEAMLTPTPVVTTMPSPTPTPNTQDNAALLAAGERYGLPQKSKAHGSLSGTAMARFPVMR